MGIREHFSAAGRKLAEDKLAWNKICAQWENVLGMANTDKNQPYPQVNYPKQIRLEDLLEKEKKDRFLYVMPGTFGDVFLSTAVIDSIKKENPDKDIYFATAQPFMNILDGNPNVFKVLQFDNIFTNIPLMNNFFERVFTPYIETQTNNNWTQNGHGKHLVETYANNCGVQVGELYLQVHEYMKPAFSEYVVVHVKTGQEAKDYMEFQKVVNRIGIPVIQVGGSNDPALKGVTDLRGKKIQETAGIIRKAKLFIGGDSICAHIAGYVGTSSILLYGSTYPKLTCPISECKISVIEPSNRFGCDRPCHLVKCNKSPIGCINNIDVDVIIKTLIESQIHVKDAVPGSISGYTTTLNPDKYYPWRESIQSMLNVCDEVIVVDGGSTDGTLEELQTWKAKDSKLKVFKRKWKVDEPGMDGMMKAFARALCTKEFCWQQDCDEIIHESDYKKIKDLTLSVPSTAKVISLPVLDLYGTSKTIREDRGLYKARFSKNLPEITHGIPKHLRKVNEHGKTFCDKNMSDGCDYINAQTFEPIDSQVTFYNQIFFQTQQNDLPAFEKLMRESYAKFPSMWHFSWHDLVRRINVDLEFWDEQWKRLNGDKDIPLENRFFPGIPRSEITLEMVNQRSEFLKDKKFDGSPMPLITIDWLDIPEIIKPWLKD